MKFVLDITVGEFIALHLESRGKNSSIASIVEVVNTITPEAIHEKMNLNMLSGGKTRALMIVDIALICDAPIVLIDEIENAGIDKTKAFALLTGENKIVFKIGRAHV